MKKLPGSAVLSSEAEEQSSHGWIFEHDVGAPLSTKINPPIKVYSCLFIFIEYITWAPYQDFLLSRPVVLKCENATNHLEFLWKHRSLNTTLLPNI